MLDRDAFERTFAQDDFEPSDYGSEEETKNMVETDKYLLLAKQNANQMSNGRKVRKGKKISKEQGNGADNDPIKWEHHIRAI